MMGVFRWFKNLWSAPSPAETSETGLSRRGFLSSLSAVVAASFLAPGLPPVPESLKFIAVTTTDFFNAQFDLIQQVQRRAAEEIMAAEDARILSYLQTMLEA